ncbi:MAG: winged helix-turn-helix transcriptional regulator [Thermoproteota archaeon]
MEKDIVDRLDVEILRILCKDPKQSSREIAKQLDVSDRTVARRISRMEKAGIILGYQLILNDYVKGIIFDANDLTEVKFNLTEWANFEGSLQGMYSTAADVILFYAGKGVGRSILRDIKINKPSIEDVLSVFSKICVLRGWGNIRIEKVGNDLIKTSLKNLKISPFLFKGILTGMLEALIGENVESPSSTEDGSILVKISGGGNL